MTLIRCPFFLLLLSVYGEEVQADVQSCGSTLSLLKRLAQELHRRLLRLRPA